MGCPQCHNDEISPSGKCLVCGHQITPANSEPISGSEEKAGSAYSAMIEIDYSAGAEQSLETGELPQWRKDLSQRLQEIRQKKEAIGPAGIPTEKKPASLSSSGGFVGSRQATPPPVIPVKPPVRKATQRPPTPPPRQRTLQPIETKSFASEPAVKKADSRDVQKLIDNAVLRQSATEKTQPRILQVAGHVQKPVAEHEGKLILLTRTLSGLVDLICVVLFTMIFLIAADFFSGIIVLDTVSLLDIAVLLVLTYFVYSVFFLGTSGQTVGMMITDLRVVRDKELRPFLRQLLSRCCWFLASLLALGIGLLWSLFNRENLCLHDRLSGTHVKRI